jgi:hypothetical protein
MVPRSNFNPTFFMLLEKSEKRERELETLGAALRRLCTGFRPANE